MKLGKVIGNLVATKKESNLDGLKILIVSYLDDTLSDTGKTVACVDSVNAGSGDIVLLCSSSSARITKTTKNAATDNTIVAIIDLISAENKYLYNKSSNSKSQN